MRDKNYVIGIDFGTDSVRAVLLDTSNGVEISNSLCFYPRWKRGLYCDSTISQYRQHPMDYIESMTKTIKELVSNAGSEIAEKIKAISVDTTGSTPVAVDETGTPLALKPGFEENPNAMFILWKDHTAIIEAAEINAHAKKFETNYLKYVGGVYSSEWYWAKLLRTLRLDKEVREQCASWVEHCDWMTFLLTGGNDVKQIKRGVCSAGHKALWAEEFGGLPPAAFFTTLDPMLAPYSDIFDETYTADKCAGNLSSEWANTLGLSTDVMIGIGAFDAHMGAVGAQIEPYYLCKVMGTSTCDMLVAPTLDVENILVAGICGQVNGSIIPNMLGLEAGQSAFGDAYAWFKQVLMWPTKTLLAGMEGIDHEKIIASIDDQIIPELSKAAAALPLSVDDELAIDWMNGRRTPYANQLLKGAFLELDLGSDAVKIFRSLVEATCFGAKKIVDQFNEQGISVRGLIGLGGIAKKSPFIMQMMADVMNMPIKIHKSEQTCAIGAGMFAATVAGIYPKVEDAMAAMGQGFETTYFPNNVKSQIYAQRYELYKKAGMFIEELSSSKQSSYE